MPRKDESPKEELSEQGQVLQGLLDVMSQEAVDLYNALPFMATREEYEAGIERFNKLGAAQLDREDSVRRQTIENETLQSREVDEVIQLPLYGRTLRITRAANGIITLASA